MENSHKTSQVSLHLLTFYELVFIITDLPLIFSCYAPGKCE
ncbi:hypothetical protein B4098_1002 [Heyndrickxia coagulans]|uniref:Uncharacterized protein n=1 Tax=Heyndrickxia coagulans TaxID=1398 RepID=A0A150K325_HEYCO|nr:hypothetical protein BCO26_0299 [Heyndrickxia coagulans 2-6]KYC63761.1 hypothetical protein B4099_1085 [Heyndrickxia coagulans]KYC65785.1 hypothetical protein B4098_1002 [Heyndrickxia coagulans]